MPTELALVSPDPICAFSCEAGYFSPCHCSRAELQQIGLCLYFSPPEPAPHKHVTDSMFQCLSLLRQDKQVCVTADTFHNNMRTYIACVLALGQSQVLSQMHVDSVAHRFCALHQRRMRSGQLLARTLQHHNKGAAHVWSANDCTLPAFVVTHKRISQMCIAFMWLRKPSRPLVDSTACGPLELATLQDINEFCLGHAQTVVPWTVSGTGTGPKMTESGDRVYPKAPIMKKHSQQELQRIAERASKAIPGAARYRSRALL